MVSVLSAVVPLTLKVVKLVMRSAAALPNTALPAIVKLCVVPSTVPPVVIVLPVKVVFTPKVTLSLYVCAPVVVTLPPLMAVVPAASVVTLLN